MDTRESGHPAIGGYQTRSDRSAARAQTKWRDVLVLGAHADLRFGSKDC